MHSSHLQLSIPHPGLNLIVTSNTNKVSKFFCKHFLEMGQENSTFNITTAKKLSQLSKNILQISTYNCTQQFHVCTLSGIDEKSNVQILCYCHSQTKKTLPVLNIYQHLKFDLRY